MYCDKCDIEFTEGLRYCKWCGGPLIERTGSGTEPLKCPSCAGEVGASWAFCKMCGQKLDFATHKPQAFCVSCGNPLDQPESTCSRCGGPTEGIAGSTETVAIDNITTVMEPSTAASFCPACGGRLESWSAFCNVCGRSVTKPGIGIPGPDTVLMRACKACNAENPPEARVCRVCGTTLSGTLRNPRLESGERASGDARATLVDTPAFIPRLTETGALQSNVTMPVPADAMPTLRVGPEEPSKAAQEPSETPSASPPQRDSRGTALIFSEPVAAGGTETLVGMPVVIPQTEADEAATIQMPAIGTESIEPSPAQGPVLSEPGYQALGQEPTPPTEVFRSGRTTSETEPPFAPEEVPLVVAEPPGAQATGSSTVGEPPAIEPQPAVLTPVVKPTAPAPPADSIQPAVSGPPTSVPPGGVPPAAAAPPGVQTPTSAPAPPAIQAPPPPMPSQPPGPTGAVSATQGQFAPPQQPPGAQGQVNQALPAGAPGEPTQRTEQINQSTQPQPGVTQPQYPGAQYPEAKYPGPKYPGPTAPVQQYPPVGRPATQPKKGGAGKLIGLFIGLVIGFVVVAALGYAAWRYRQSRTQTTGPVATPTPLATLETQVSPEASPSAAPTSTPSLAPEGMALVPAGIYTIGREGGDTYSSPTHRATLRAFYIDTREVTNAEYKKFMDATGHKAPDDWTGGDYPLGNDNYPVVGVSWKDASAYAAWADKRLPTEEEWEAAARGPEAFLYPWGNDWRPGAANIGTRGIVEVGSFKEGASPFGALDMIGNVWEWTSDEFRTYPGNTHSLPYDLSPGKVYRVIRGGSYDGNKTNDATYRGFLEENKGYPKTGFRCVKTAENRQEGSTPGN